MIDSLSLKLTGFSSRWIVTGALQVAPPFVDVDASTAESPRGRVDAQRDLVQASVGPEADPRVGRTQILRQTSEQALNAAQFRV